MFLSGKAETAVKTRQAFYLLLHKLGEFRDTGVLENERTRKLYLLPQRWLLVYKQWPESEDPGHIRLALKSL